MNFVLVDDEHSHHEILKTKLQWACDQLKIACKIALATENWCEAIDYANKAEDGTVWFLDIELSDSINGIDLCRMIQEQNIQAYIVYVSAYQQYALKCCQSHAFDFLLKPWTDQQLLDCLKAIHKENERLKNGHYLTVELASRIIHLKMENILYFSKERMAIVAHYSNGRTFSWRESMESVEKRIKEKSFIQIHKSYLVNIPHIQEINWSEDCILIDNGEQLPISRRRSSELKTILCSKTITL